MSYKPTQWKNRVYDEQGNILEDGTGLWAEYLNNMEEGIVNAHIYLDSRGQPDGIATLDENGVVNTSQLPANLKEMEVVHSLEEMNNIDPKFKGLRVMVIVQDKWNEYVYDGTQFIEVGSSEQLNITLDWDNIKDKPVAFTPKEHTHSESDIKDLDKYTKEETDQKLSLKAEKSHSHIVGDITDLSVYSKEEIDTKLKEKAEKEHSHKELHEHSNKNVLDKIIHLGDQNQIDLGRIYDHTHNYVDIKGTPIIPTKLSELSDDRNLVVSNQSRKIHVSHTEPTNAKEGDLWIRI